MTPRLRKHFKVSIETNTPPLLEAYSVLESQLVSIDLGTENISTRALQHIKGSVVLWLSDDDNSSLMHAIRQIQYAQDEFVIHVQVGHPDHKRTEKYSFYGCRAVALQHSILSVEPATDTLNAVAEGSAGRFKVKGDLRASSNRDNSMKLMQIEFTKMLHSFVSEEPQV